MFVHYSGLRRAQGTQNETLTLQRPTTGTDNEHEAYPSLVTLVFIESLHYNKQTVCLTDPSDAFQSSTAEKLDGERPGTDWVLWTHCIANIFATFLFY